MSVHQTYWRRAKKRNGSKAMVALCRLSEIQRLGETKKKIFPFSKKRSDKSKHERDLPVEVLEHFIFTNFSYCIAFDFLR